MNQVSQLGTPKTLVLTSYIQTGPVGLEQAGTQITFYKTRLQRPKNKPDNSIPYLNVIKD